VHNSRRSTSARLAHWAAVDGCARFEIGSVTLTRVPYFDVALDPAVVGLTSEQIDATPWAKPTWVNADGQALVGQAGWVIESQGRVLLVDPCGAADAFIRSGPEAVTHQEAFLAAMRAAGFAPERVDAVVLSHLDGIGMAAAVEPDGPAGTGWGPLFPNARVVLTATELAWLDGQSAVGGLDALRALVARGIVDGVADDHRFTDEVRFERTGGHSPGHAVVHVESGGAHAMLLGHLALNPLQLTTVPHAGGHVDVAAANAWLAPFVARATESTLLVGPLWPFPGAARFTDDREIVAA
jgi:glyoxylase-like metal-dependent hydrolase (beta-lactamase superfamily II)